MPPGCKYFVLFALKCVLSLWLISYDDGVYPEVDARDNWWGGGNPAFVSGRIWERGDDDNLIGVVFTPFHETNQSILQGNIYYILNYTYLCVTCVAIVNYCVQNFIGRCDPGWRLFEQRCFLYFGGVSPYHVAEQNCRVSPELFTFLREIYMQQYVHIIFYYFIYIYKYQYMISIIEIILAVWFACFVYL